MLHKSFQSLVNAKYADLKCAENQGIYIPMILKLILLQAYEFAESFVLIESVDLRHNANAQRVFAPAYKVRAEDSSLGNGRSRNALALVDLLEHIVSIINWHDDAPTNVHSDILYPI